MTTNPAWMQPSFWMRRRFYVIAPVLLFIIFVVLVPRPNLPRWRSHSGQSGTIVVDVPKAHIGSGNSPREQAANATLGFEKLLALSMKPSWRTRGLLAAAKYTGLQIDIPIQAHDAPELVEAFEKIGSGTPGVRLPGPGSAHAWLAHLDMIKYVIANGWESAFVMEDDVDWDVRLFDQLRLVSDNVRQFVGAEETDTRPYGGSWDVIWMGHCGELSNENQTRMIQFEDSTVPEIEQYGGWSKKFLRAWVPEGVRIVQEAKQPVCTFGYGFTKESAQKILTAVGKGADEAFDVALQHHCTGGDLKCIVVNPEIMHHYEPDGGHGYVSEVKEADGRGHSANEAEFEHIKGTTSNIVFSARCKAIFDDTCLAPPWELNN